MKESRKKYSLSVLLFALFFSVLFTGSMVSAEDTGGKAKTKWDALGTTNSYTVQLMEWTTAKGSYLGDSKGMTLYQYKNDSYGNSTCTGSCLQNWPAFYKDSIVVPDNLNKNDFGTITRADGNKQTTYRGWPLYYYTMDKKPGDTKGHGMNGVWSVIFFGNVTP
ncbi:MAG TPA: hypothetical protein VHO70_16745 [Chitinispirillaceae bacterium]|nr:hypothetical protein [Chitinispirillaceae bacterium]